MGNNLSPYTNVNGYSWDCWIDFGELRGDFLNQYSNRQSDNEQLAA